MRPKDKWPHRWSEAGAATFATKGVERSQQAREVAFNEPRATEQKGLFVFSKIIR